MSTMIRLFVTLCVALWASETPAGATVVLSGDVVATQHAVASDIAAPLRPATPHFDAILCETETLEDEESTPFAALFDAHVQRTVLPAIAPGIAPIALSPAHASLRLWRTAAIGATGPPQISLTA